MKKLIIGKTGRITGVTLLAIVLFGLVPITNATGQSHVYANNFTKPKSAEIYKPATLQIAVYQVENTAKFKVHFENTDSSPVTIKVRNAGNQVLYQEVVKDKKYVRKFDMENIEDGDYTFEISNKKEKYIKEIQLQTLSARTIQIQE